MRSDRCCLSFPLSQGFFDRAFPPLANSFVLGTAVINTHLPGPNYLAHPPGRGRQVPPAGGVGGRGGLHLLRRRFWPAGPRRCAAAATADAGAQAVSRVLMMACGDLIITYIQTYSLDRILFV